jgi:hypothetical protein
MPRKYICIEKKASVAMVLIVVLVGLYVAAGSAKATYYDYGTCQSKSLNAVGTVSDATYGQTTMNIFGYMNSDYVIENSGGLYIQYDYFEFGGSIYSHPGGGTALINVGYPTNTGDVYYVITNGTNVQVTITLHNSTTISFTVDKGCTIQLIVDSNQFVPPASFETYTVSLQADSGVTNSTTLETC